MNRAIVSATVGMVMVGAACAGQQPRDATPLAPSAARADSTGTYDIAAVAVKPRLNNQSTIARVLAQSYPGQLREAGVRGTTSLRMVVEPDGSTSNVSVIRSSGYVEMDQGAVRVGRAMRFTPAMVNGRPVRVRVDLPVTFARD